MQLRELQGLFQRRVLQGDPRIDAELSGATSVDFMGRLSTYTKGYRSRLVEALSTTFPAFKAVLGDDEFERLTREFIETAPSRHYSIRYYGQGLAAFVRTARTEPDVSVLYDLAQWEWLLAEVFDAADDAPIGAESLAAIAPEIWPTVSFVLRACVRPITTHSNAVQWWRWARDNAVMPAAYERAPAASWRLWRQDVRTLFRSMDAGETAALAVACQAGTFDQICASIAEVTGPDEAPLRAASILKSWFADQIIGDLHVVE